MVSSDMFSFRQIDGACLLRHGLEYKRTGYSV
ncbi:hypothetical protein EDC61_10781 [Sulfuritortus calidifontis]|uniref:Uncharacterized protein n=1 Tax=Sulfuritortus calidifontis TaxID=1914471 RepID=A0A4R3JVI4_9PROT|nr:hypothetical protein EDC61_10781 [Sulfuritortus calidifontis]